MPSSAAGSATSPRTTGPDGPEPAPLGRLAVNLPPPAERHRLKSLLPPPPWTATSWGTSRSCVSGSARLPGDDADARPVIGQRQHAVVLDGIGREEPAELEVTVRPGRSHS